VPVIAGFPEGWRPPENPGQFLAVRGAEPDLRDVRAAEPVQALRADQRGGGARDVSCSVALIRRMPIQL
jgi:hypothetical protein